LNHFRVQRQTAQVRNVQVFAHFGGAAADWDEDVGFGFATRTDEAGHVLHNTQNRDVNFLAEGDFFADIKKRDLLNNRRKKRDRGEKSGKEREESEDKGKVESEEKREKRWVVISEVSGVRFKSGCARKPKAGG
jgi:hypothetical protein